MTNEKDDVMIETLNYYKNMNKKLHIKIILGTDEGKFRNGFIISINEEENFMMFDDAKMGSLKYNFNEISNKIKVFTEAY